MNYPSAIDQFFSEEKKGECGNDEFELGNLHRKIIKCKFCVNGECHYTGECKRRNNPGYFDGWDWA